MSSSISLPVEFLTVSNQQKDLAQVYRQHDGFIYCAEWDEPFALTPLEAMASGIPVIAARSGGVRELLRAGENGWVYKPGDALELDFPDSGSSNAAGVASADYGDVRRRR